MKKYPTLIVVVLFSALLTLAFGASFAVAGTGFSDDFSGSELYVGWTFVNPDAGGSYDLTSNPGWIRITAPNKYDLGHTPNTAAPRILQQVTGDFVAFTKVVGNFGNSDVHAGLLVYLDANNYVRVERRGTQSVDICGKEGGVFGSTQVSLGSEVSPTYLKVQKTGVTVEGLWSSDGVNWNRFGARTLLNSDSVYVGLLVVNIFPPPYPFSADFDYFTISPQLFVAPEYPIGALAVPLAMGAALLIFRSGAGFKKTKRGQTAP